GRHRKQTDKKRAERVLSALALGALAPLAVVVGAGVAASVDTAASDPYVPPPVAAAPPTPEPTSPGSVPPPPPTPVTAEIEKLPDPKPEPKKRPNKAPEKPRKQTPDNDTVKGDSGAQKPPVNPKWGSPDVVDEFNGNELNRKLWKPYNGEGHNGNGRRTPDAITV